MKKTTPTDGNSPAVALEPGEFIRRLACISASCGRPETTYLVNTAMRIGKRVLVGTLHFDPFSRACYHLEALAAENVFACVRFFLFSFILNNLTGLFTAVFLRRLPKKITIVCITCNHFLIEIVRCLLLVVRDLCKTALYARFLRQAQISILEIFYIFLWFKFSPSLNSNINYHFPKVSVSWSFFTQLR